MGCDNGVGVRSEVTESECGVRKATASGVRGEKRRERGERRVDNVERRAEKDKGKGEWQAAHKKDTCGECKVEPCMGDHP